MPTIYDPRVRELLRRGKHARRAIRDGVDPLLALSLVVAPPRDPAEALRIIQRDVSAHRRLAA